MQTVNIHEAKTHLSRLIDQSMRRRMLAVQEDAAPLVEWASGFVSGSKIDGCDDQNSTPCCHYPQ